MDSTFSEISLQAPCKSLSSILTKPVLVGPHIVQQDENLEGTLLSENTQDFIENIIDNGGIIAGGFARWYVSEGLTIKISHYNILSSSIPYIAHYKPIFKYMNPAYYYSRKPFGDIDIFCKNKKSFSKLKKYLQDTYHKGKKSKYALNYKDNIINTNIQLVFPVEGTYGTPESIIDKFDFSVCRIALLSKNHAIADINWEKDEKDHVINIINKHSNKELLALRLAKYHVLYRYSLKIKDVLEFLIKEDTERLVKLCLFMAVKDNKSFFSKLIDEMYTNFISIIDKEKSIISPHTLKNFFEKLEEYNEKN